MQTHHYRLSLLVMAMMSSQAWACSVHDHLCSYHALGVPNTSLPINNASTSLIIYAQTDNPSAGINRTDFDNHVLVPQNTKIIDAVSPTQIRDTGPYIGSCTNYLCDTVGGERVIKPERLPSFWNDSTTMPRHVYPSRYQVVFNQNSAKAYHTGDLNGGERGQFSPQMGCPSKEGQANCEAVVIIGTDAGGGTNTVPTGIYSQKIHMFDYYNQNPSATMVVGAYATGHGVLIQQSHVDNATTELLGLPKTLIDIAYANGQATNITSSVNTMFDLVGKNAESAQFDYHFYNRGFDAHAAGVKGVTSWQYKQYKPLGWGSSFEQTNLVTGNTDIKQVHYGRTDTRTTVIGAEGERGDAWRQGHVYQDGQRTVGVVEMVRPVPKPIDVGVCYIDDRLNTRLERGESANVYDGLDGKTIPDNSINVSQYLDGFNVISKLSTQSIIYTAKTNSIDNLSGRIGQDKIPQVANLTTDDFTNGNGNSRVMIFTSPNSSTNQRLLSASNDAKKLETLGKALTVIKVTEYQSKNLEKYPDSHIKVTVGNLVRTAVGEGLDKGLTWVGCAAGASASVFCGPVAPICAPISGAVGCGIGIVSGYNASNAFEDKVDPLLNTWYEQ